MNVFFEESGDFKAGAVLSQQGESSQVELPTGKRSKVKARDVLLEFSDMSAEQLLIRAREVATAIDIDFLWEVAGEDEFGFAELGAEYFGRPPLSHEAAGLLLCLQHAPIYFYRKGRGRYKPAPQAALQAAQAGIEKKKQLALRQAEWVDLLIRRELPEEWRGKIEALLYRPDKNGIEYKALMAASDATQLSPARLMLACGGILSPKQLHLQKFLFEYFPKGTHFQPVTVPSSPSLPLATVAAFSIDDVTTTEIDDALSVTSIGNNLWRVGIHIAAPGLGVQRGDALDAIARSRLSTVYMPGDKITMLPDDLVAAYTLAEGRSCPAVSLYATIDGADWQISDIETRIEMVPIAANLRNNHLNDLVTEENLAEDLGDYPFKREIGVLWQWALVLEQGRMQKRAEFGLRPEQNNRVDFNFYVDDDVVTIDKRRRGSPLDKIVAEMMIFANSSWGKMISDHGIPGIYRSQGGGGGVRMQVRMVTHAAPHQGLGVDQYAWSTSPLRRYTDLVNQWQIMACVQHGVAAPLVAPFKPRDADLFAIVSAFDAAYAAYNEFQGEMERYWCLRWLAQNAVREVEAVLLKPDLVRLTDIPLVIRIAPLADVARGASLRIELLRWDEVDLSVEARLVEVLQGQASTAPEDEPEMEADVSQETLPETQAEDADNPLPPSSESGEPVEAIETAGSEALMTGPDEARVFQAT